jgi:hypothetical protein
LRDEVASKTDWVVIDKAQGELAAGVIKSLLESNGIPVLLEAKSGGSVYAFSVGSLGEVRILVPKVFADKARELIKPEE